MADGRQPLRHLRQCAIPCHLLKAVTPPDEGNPQSLRMVDEGRGVPALDAQSALAHWVLLGREDTHNLAVQHLNIEPASGSAVDTGGEDVLISHDCGLHDWTLLIHQCL